MLVLRFAVPGEAVHRHGSEGSPRICHQAEEGGEDEGGQRAGNVFKLAVCSTCFAGLCHLFLCCCGKSSWISFIALMARMFH